MEQRIGQHTARTNGPVVADTAGWQHLAEDFERVWHDPACDVRVKKRIVRTLIREVIADVDVAAGEIVLVIHWQGGVHTELRVPRRRRGRHGHETAIPGRPRSANSSSPSQSVAGAGVVDV